MLRTCSRYATPADDMLHKLFVILVVRENDFGFSLVISGKYLPKKKKKMVIFMKITKMDRIISDTILS